MKNRTLHRPLLSAGWLVALLTVCATIAVTAGLSAQSPSTDVYRVEEDWSLVVNQPDLDNNGPQVTCAISPADMTTAYCALDLNYHTQPDYVAGGLQIHTWDPTDPIEIANSVHTGMLNSPGETVTWTQTMTWSANALTFQVINGQSQTWGSFGGKKNGSTGRLILTLPTGLSNLNSYDPNVTLDNSGVSFASNLVDSLTLVAVRWYDINGNLIQQITTPQAVHPQN
jgi:hypothetical protein